MRFVKGVVTGLAVMAFLTAAAAEEGRDALIERGRTIYADQGCHGCHTMGAAGTPIASDLSHIGAKYSERDLGDWLRDPSMQKPTAHMPKIELTAADVEALAAYLASLR